MNKVLDGFIRNASEKPDVNPRAMGSAVGLSIIAVVVSYVCGRFLGGGAWSLHSLIVYLCAALFLFFVFFSARRSRYWIGIPTAVLFICYIIGALTEKHLPGWFKAFSIFLAFLALALFAAKLCGVIRWVFPAVTIAALTGFGCMAYAVFDIAVTAANSVAEWSDTVSAGSSSFISGLLSGENLLESFKLQQCSFPFLLPVSLLFYATALTSLMLAEPRNDDDEEEEA